MKQGITRRNFLETISAAGFGALAASATKAWGLDAVAGGYWDLDLGIGMPQTLLTFDVLANAPGGSGVNAGPDTDIMGDDFFLNESTILAVDYSGAIATIDVVPEPGTITLLVLGAVLFGSRLLVRRKT